MEVQNQGIREDGEEGSDSFTEKERKKATPLPRGYGISEMYLSMLRASIIDLHVHIYFAFEA